MPEPPRLTRRAEREAAERRHAFRYEILLSAGALVLGGALLAAFGTVLYASVLAPRSGAPQPAELQPGLLGSGESWSGYLRVPADDRYTFTCVPAGSARLEIAGRAVLGSGQAAGAADLAAGHHALRVEYAGADARLYWESDVRPREIIPSHALFHAKK